MADRLASFQVNELHILPSAFLAEDPDGLAVDDLQIHGIAVTEVGNVSKPLQRRLPQLLLLFQVVSNDCASCPARQKLGVNQHVSARREDRAVMPFPGAEFLAIIGDANDDLAKLVLRTNTFILALGGWMMVQ